MIKLQCIGCKQTRSITIEEAGGVIDVLLCEPMERPAITRAQCRPWDIEPDVGRVVDGLPAVLVEDELRALGNAVVPQIPELIGRAIMTITIG